MKCKLLWIKASASWFELENQCKNITRPTDSELSTDLQKAKTNIGRILKQVIQLCHKLW